MPNNTIDQMIRSAAAELASSSTTPRLDAELLLAHVLGWSRTRLLAERTYQPDSAMQQQFAALVARRKTLEPVAYILGKREFYGLEFLVDRRVLVPRPETELLVELALSEARRLHHASNGSLQIADIGTGSGAIAVALAQHLPEAQIFAVDLSADALAVAQTNVQRHNLSEQITLVHGNLLEPLRLPVDLLVSNPPYTILAEIEPNVRAHEPWLALEGGPDGAEIYRRMAIDIARVVKPHGVVVLEIGAWQGEVVSGLLQAALPDAQINIHKDLTGRDRVVTARRP